jgi:hypothetical protein
MKFDVIGLLVYLSVSKKENIFNFDRLSKRPPWGSGLSTSELQNLRLECGWTTIPDVRMEGNQFVVRIRKQVFKTASSPTMLAHLKMHMW